MVKRKATDEEIIDMIHRSNAITQRELEQKLGYVSQGLGNRLKKLIVNGLIEYIIIPRNSMGAKYKFIHYSGSRVYFVDGVGLAKWFEIQYKDFRKSVSQNINQFGLHLSFKIEER